MLAEADSGTITPMIMERENATVGNEGERTLKEFRGDAENLQK